MFPLPEVGELLNARLINYKLDAKSKEQKGLDIASRDDFGV